MLDLRVRLGKPPWRTARLSATGVPVLSIVIVVVIMENEVRFFWWLFLFHLRVIEECAIEVLVSGSRRKPWCLFGRPREVAPSFHCECSRFPPLCRRADPALETLHGAEAHVQQRIVSAHGLGKESHGLLFDAVLHRLLGRDVCGLQFRCGANLVRRARDTLDEQHGPIPQGSLPVDRGTIPQ